MAGCHTRDPQVFFNYPIVPIRWLEQVNLEMAQHPTEKICRSMPGAKEPTKGLRIFLYVGMFWASSHFVSNLAQEPFRWLLDSHFCWIQPLFNFVYRPAFTRTYF